MAYHSSVIDPARIAAARRRIAPFVHPSPLLAIGDRRYLKLESLNPTGSFKIRGFFAEALSADRSALHRGILTVSAGNAAQAAAYVAHRLGVPCRTFMFDTAPPTKIEGVRRWGGVPVFLTRQEVLDWLGAEGWRDESELFIHPFAGDELIAGHASIGEEIVESVPDVARVIVPVGGGGLISGIGSALKAHRPGIEIVGVQSDGYDLWPRTFATGTPPTLVPRTIADGTTGPWSARMHAHLAALVDRWIAVPEAAVRAAVRDLALGHRLIAEGAGALPFAALGLLPPDDRPTVAILSGGNIDTTLLRDLLA